MTDPFLEHRKEQEKAHAEANANATHPIASLISVELNVMDACNRACRFCPHNDPVKYPNKVHWRMERSTAQKVAKDLASFGYKGRISLSGYGEPLIHPKIFKLIGDMRRILPDTVIEMNTNGDPLTPDRIHALAQAGLTNLYINLYDGPWQVAKFQQMFAQVSSHGLNHFFRRHWDGAERFGLELNNRSGMVTDEETGLGPRAEPWMGQPCHYPFYKMFVDWNGDVLFCANDWGRARVVGNVLQCTLMDIWLGDKMREVRERLAVGDRSEAPCNTCSVNGTLHGKFSFDLLNRVYEEDGRAAPHAEETRQAGAQG